MIESVTYEVNIVKAKGLKTFVNRLRYPSGMLPPSKTLSSTLYASWDKDYGLEGSRKFRSDKYLFPWNATIFDRSSNGIFGPIKPSRIEVSIPLLVFHHQSSFFHVILRMGLTHFQCR